MTSIISRIEALEFSIKEYEEEIERIDRKLRLGSVTFELRCKIEEQQTIVKEQLSDARRRLQKLRRENGKSFIVSLSCLAILAAMYHYAVGFT